jgi:hypothetical protein
MPVLQQERATKRSREKLSACSMLLGIHHSEHRKPVRVSGELLIPVSLAETATDTMNCSEAFEVADGDFVR